MQSVIEYPPEHSRRGTARTGASSSTASAPSPSAPPNLHQNGAVPGARPRARARAHSQAGVACARGLRRPGGGRGALPSGDREYLPVPRPPSARRRVCRTAPGRCRPSGTVSECAVSPSRVPSAQTNKPAEGARSGTREFPVARHRARAAPELRYGAHAFAASLAQRTQTIAPNQPTAACGRRRSGRVRRTWT